MASHARTTGAWCHFITEGSGSATVRLVPGNSEAKTLMDAFFTSHGSKTTVAVTQEDAGRDGYAQTSEAYKSLKMVFS